MVALVSAVPTFVTGLTSSLISLDRARFSLSIRFTKTCTRSGRGVLLKLAGKPAERAYLKSSLLGELDLVFLAGDPQPGIHQGGVVLGGGPAVLQPDLR